MNNNNESMRIKSFFKDGIVYGVGGVLTKFVGVFTAPIYTRFLDTDGFGKLDLATTIGAILVILVGMSMNSGYARSYYESKKENSLDKLTGTVLLFIFLAGGATLVTGILFNHEIAVWVEGIEAALLIPVFANVLPLLIISSVQIMLRFEKKPVSYVAITICNVGLTGLCGILAVVWLKEGVYGVLWANALVSYVVAIPSLYLMFRYTSFRFNFTYFKETISYSAPIMPARIGSWVKEYASRFFIVGALSLSALGVYSFAIKIALILKLAENAFKLTWSPKQVELYGIRDSEQTFARVLDYYLLGFFLLCVVITALSPLAVLILATSAFYSATALVGLLCAAYMWDGSVNILAAGNSWSRKTYYNSFGSIIAGLVAVAILWIGIGRWGLIVAPAALFISSIIKSILILWTAQLNHKIPYSYRNLSVMIFSTMSFSLISYFIFKNDTLTMFISSISVLSAGLVIFIPIFMIVLTSKQRKKVFKLVSNNSLTNKLKK